MNTTIHFAEYELNRYLAAMGVRADIALLVQEEHFDRNRYENCDFQLDDAFEIAVSASQGTIIATNSRAVLLGVYHFLKMQGCRFLRPGTDGEYIPQIDAVKDCNETVYAKYRHRGTNSWHFIGGFDNVLELIDWLPKAMLNTFMIELTDAFYDMLFCYRPGENPYAKEYKLSREQYERWYSRIVTEIKKRGLLYHGAGHGFTNLLMDGITEVKTFSHIAGTDDKTPCVNTDILAQINGKRELFNGIPLNTNLCFSQEAVRKQFAKTVYDYAVRHSEMDYLHVWLADAFSNYCECENCRKLSPSDWYVKLLNEIDEEFTRHRSKQKIVFLIYFELLYPPKSERIKNEDRFTMLFCPYGRDFTKSYRSYCPKEYKPLELNKYTLRDMDAEIYLTQLRDWKKIFHGDCLVFDYTFFDITCHTDLTSLNYIDNLADDCLFFKNLGLNGKIECGNIRSMTPSSIKMNVIAEGLFYGTSRSMDTHFADLFGKEEPVSAFLKKIQYAIPQEYITCKRSVLTETEKEDLASALARTQEFRQILFEYDPLEKFYRRNCIYFAKYLDLLEFIFSVILKLNEQQETEDVEKYVEEVRRIVFRLEGITPLYIGGFDKFYHMRNLIRKQFGRREF